MMRAMDDPLEILLTVGDWVRYAATRFAESDLAYGHGTEDPLDEAYALVVSALGIGPELPPAYHASRLLPEERRRLAALVEERITTRRPVPYLTHVAYCAGLRFYVDERVLIPRSPLAELIGARFEPWIDALRVRRILDLGTGSGALAVACALAFPDAVVTATDLSADALEVARINVDRHGLETRIALRQGDLYDAFLGASAPFDLIVSNPPYVPEGRRGTLPAEYGHEPPLAFWAGADGLAVIDRILAGAVRWLHPEHGLLALECGDASPALYEKLRGCEGFVWPDLESGRRDVLLAPVVGLRGYTGYAGAR
jgi:ribosomal protein L3 glutamine methyltransferase